MDIHLSYNNETWKADLSKPLDISISMGNDKKAKVNCYFATPFQANPVKADSWEGSVKTGFPVNFYDIAINPHGNGTHTECFGHLSVEMQSVSDQLKEYHFISQLISISPSEINGDLVFTLSDIEHIEFIPKLKGLVIRTLPNESTKLFANYSGANPPYFDAALIAHFNAMGITHIIIDLPSIDKESDGGLLAGHRAFWNNGSPDRLNCTITELVYIDNSIKDGLYLVNLQLAPIELDASPSRPVLFSLETLNS